MVKKNFSIIILLFVNVYFKTFCTIFIDQQAKNFVNNEWIEEIKKDYSYNNNDNNFYLVVVNNKDLVYKKSDGTKPRIGSLIINKKLKDINNTYDDNKFLVITQHYIETLENKDKKECNLVRIIEKTDPETINKIISKNYNDIYYDNTESANIKFNNNTGAILEITCVNGETIQLFCSNISYNKGNLKGMFEGNKDIKSIVVNIVYNNNYQTPCMFENCTNLEYFQLKNRYYEGEYDHTKHTDNINARYCYHMFENCENLKTVDIGKINFIKECNSLFNKCKNLKEIKFTKESKLEECYELFNDCENLEKVNFNREEIIFYNRSSNIFTNCKKLKELTGIKKIIFKDIYHY